MSHLLWRGHPGEFVCLCVAAGVIEQQRDFLSSCKMGKFPFAEQRRSLCGSRIKMSLANRFFLATDTGWGTSLQSAPSWQSPPAFFRGRNTEIFLLLRKS